MRLNDEQFDRLWAKQAVNEFNNLEYREFLKQYNSSSDEKISPKQDATANKDDAEIQLTEACAKPTTSGDNDYNLPRPPSRTGTAEGNRGHVMRSATPIVNADSAEAKVKTLVFKHWQEIQRECRKIDADGSGCVLPDEFVGILDNFGVMLSLEDARQLMVKYDLGENAGKFSYRDFLRHFILTLKPQEEGILRRRKIHTARLPVDTGKESASFIEAMVKLRERILHCWKEMRRSFRMIDSRGDGFVTPSIFRQVLRQFAINLSEEDFFHMLSFYDHGMRGRVPYNDFIRAFLQ
uniref:EF-hand calcium-binding domain-containing protein 6-like n=1 Tax=Phallusia mammillata TaxID=59560 RepID=A0A6F9DAY8_9ASCI|nr:EF-hand calcium-binding domain-containing protein 6-like [Phallusia mammillata]